MISRTYPAEYSTFDGDAVIITQIRDKIGDRVSMKRYILPDTETSYVMGDGLTFYDEDTRYWPYHIVHNSTTYSGVDNPQVLNYQYMVFDSPVDLSTNASDFWVESFYLSDFEIWTAYLSVDLTPLVLDSDCITDDMNILQAAIDLIDPLRTIKARFFYGGLEVRDNDTTYRKYEMRQDPYKDLVNRLQKQLQALIDECNTRLYHGGFRLE